MITGDEKRQKEKSTAIPMKIHLKNRKKKVDFSVECLALANISKTHMTL